jgi:hypothetical protein
MRGSIEFRKYILVGNLVPAGGRLRYSIFVHARAVSSISGAFRVYLPNVMLALFCYPVRRLFVVIFIFVVFVLVLFFTHRFPLHGM